MKFTVYSKPGCPYCDQIERVLNLANLEHKIYTLGEDFTRDQFYAEFGNGSTFPQVIMNEQHLGGCVNTVQYLRENKLI
jgi:glutaredoxin